MTSIRRGFMIAFLFLFLVLLPGSLVAETPSDETAREVIALLKAQNSRLSKDLRRIQREVAALRADLAEPGVKDIFAGVGYIFGLFGVAAFAAARRKG
ncbi:MAG: hypothetical protein U5R49_17665 [Deltaproteobacteria bacterium]|nr:hypothetical protein [Deltaproteobacteria bacterium]